MSWRTNTVAIFARNTIRSLGLHGPIVRLLNRDSGYEDAFHKTMMARLKEGQTAWDVGANVGFYTAAFADLVGPGGTVCAFEPSPRNFAQLSKAMEGRPNVLLLPVALGDTGKTVRFLEDLSDETTSRVADEGGIEIAMKTGDAVVAADEAPRPHFIKVDVEGYELEVLRGLTAVIRDPALKTLAVEVHFSLLEARGLKGAPAEIERMIEDAGMQVRWTDASHIVASRG